MGRPASCSPAASHLPTMGDASVPTNVTIRPYERDGLLQKDPVESRPTPPRLTLAVNLGGWAGAQRRWLTQTLFLYPSHLTNAALIQRTDSSVCSMFTIIARRIRNDWRMSNIPPTNAQHPATILVNGSNDVAVSSSTPKATSNTPRRTLPHVCTRDSVSVQESGHAKIRIPMINATPPRTRLSHQKRFMFPLSSPLVCFK